ncbi:hypothetical protein ABZ714_24845 [Streptomyces sp. NPDC006798]|uniref:hypothetical protein n=1 Tax=Streptomyces sp. NPDC006798 TaxID=3155462 RepID=UPI0033F77671
MPDDFPVRLVGLGPPPRNPGGERRVHLLDGGEGPAGQDVVADGQDLPLDPALALRPVGGQHIDIEIVVAGEADCLRMQRNRLTGGDMAADTVLARS